MCCFTLSGFVLRTQSLSQFSPSTICLAHVSCSICSNAFCSLRSRSFEKIGVSQLTWNALNPIEKFTPNSNLWFASGKAQPYLPHVTPRVPRSVHAKFHADWSKTEHQRDSYRHTHTHRQSSIYYIDYHYHI